MPYLLFPRQFWIVATLLLAGLTGWAGYHCAEYFDDAWFAEQAWWFNHGGRVRSTLFRGVNGWENGLYVYHKLFVRAEAALLGQLGYGVRAAKLLSLLAGLAGAGLLWLTTRPEPPETRRAALLLYGANGCLMLYVFVNRPETMCMALGLASYGLLVRGSGGRGWRAGGAGVLAGLAVLAHLNGLIYLVAGAGWLLWQRAGGRAVLAFATAGGLTAAVYGLDALLDGQIPLLINQFRYDPATVHIFGWRAKLDIMREYPQVFFHSEGEIGLSVLGLLGLIFHYAHPPRPPVPMALPYLGLLVVTFWLLTKKDTDYYFLLFLPWLSMLAAHWLRQAATVAGPAGRRGLRAFVLAYLVLGFMRIQFIYTDGQRLPDVEVQNARLARQMPRRGTCIVAPLEFFFGQMDQYQIRSLSAWFWINRMQYADTLSLPHFFALAERDSVEYIVTDYRQNMTIVIRPDDPARIGHYERIYQDQWNGIYAHKKSDR